MQEKSDFHQKMSLRILFSPRVRSFRQANFSGTRHSSNLSNLFIYGHVYTKTFDKNSRKMAIKLGMRLEVDSNIIHTCAQKFPPPGVFLGKTALNSETNLRFSFLI